MDISNSRRILAVSLGDSSQHLSRVVKELTGTVPESPGTSLAGTTHLLELKTNYYTASVPIWLDLISSPSEWSASFLSPEAKEVLEVLGGIVLVFSLPSQPDTEEAEAAKELIQHVGKVVKDGLGGWGWDGVGLCLGLGEIDEVDYWDDCAAECGLEFVQVRANGGDARNEFGEKTGIPRAREALEANDWSQADFDVDSDFGDFEGSLGGDADTAGLGKDDDPSIDPETLDFGYDKADFEGLKRAIWNAGQEDEEDIIQGEPSVKPSVTGTKESDEATLDDEDIQKLEGMMRKLQAVRDMNAGLPEEQRKRMAAKAVQEVMKDL